MANDFQDCLAYVTHMRAKHDRLRECIQLIELKWAPQVDPLRTANNTSQVLDGLQKLRAELAHHFEEEESGGCVEEAVSHQVSLCDKMTELEHEHSTLLEGLDQLIDHLQACSPSDDSTDKVKQEFQRFAKQLHDHESAENFILEQSFGIEVD
jgi:iron-sulfur cluster repair protein YtfE (RIC family)